MMIAGVNDVLAFGKRVKQKLIMPNVPTLSSTPSSRTEVPGVADAAASGNHVWNGTSGALIAKAMKKPRKSKFSVSESIFRVWSASISKVRPI